MNKFKKWIVSLAITLILITGAIFSGERVELNQSFTESEKFSSLLIDYKTQLSYFELNRLSEDEAIKKLTVSKSEINDYRTRYGTLGEQVENIKNQYVDDIAEAKKIKAKKVVANLKAERDAKIKDITKNFEDSDYVKEKILKEKKKELENYYANLDSNISSLKQQYPYFAYSLKNVRTGETKTSGDLQNTNFFKVTYNSQTHGAFYDIQPRDDLSYIIKNNSDSSDEFSESVSEDVPTTSDVYVGSISISDEATKGTTIEKQAKKYDTIQRFYLILAIGSGILGLIACIILLKNRKSYKIFKLPIEIQLVGAFFLFLFSYVLAGFLSDGLYEIFSFGAGNDPFYTFIMLVIPFVIWTMLTFGIHFIMSIIQKVKNTEELWEESLTKKTGEMLVDLFLNLNLVIKVTLYLIILFLAGFGFYIAANNYYYAKDILLFYCFLFIVFVVPTTIYFYNSLAQLNKVIDKTEKIVEQNSNEKIILSKKSPFKELAEQINTMKDGVESSQFEQSKSDRLKTELVTNVSHDLRTPLTSIITYTELLKKEDLSQEEKTQYVDVIDKKTQRLKMLIDDLFEISKMSTGNVELTKQDVDITQLLQQALGEHESDIKNSALRFEVNLPKNPIIINIDGQKYWRAIDNLISNAIKYAMDGTRVFVVLEDIGNEIQLTMKNISKYEISEDVNELYERFKRADASGHTEGSGLGLAIAQSIVELHKGNMTISIDGDLFKVVVRQLK